MTLAYTILTIFLLLVASAFYFKWKGKKSPYFSMKLKLESELTEAKFKNDWKKIQESNLFLIWLKIIAKVEKDIHSDIQKEGAENSNLAALNEEEIRFPLKLEFDSLYHYPLASEIISGYGKLLAENDYKLYKPESILPFPKETILKAIDFILEYFNLEKPLYETMNKKEFATNIKTTRFVLLENFVDTGDVDLPKDGIENIKIGQQIKTASFTNSNM